MLKRQENSDFHVSFDGCHLIYQSISGLVSSEHHHSGHELFLQIQGQSRIRTIQDAKYASPADSAPTAQVWHMNPGQTLFVPAGCQHELLGTNDLPVERLILLFEDSTSEWGVSLPRVPFCMVSQQLLSELLLFLLENPDRSIAVDLARNLRSLVSEILLAALTIVDDAGPRYANASHQAELARLKKPGQRQDPRLRAALALWEQPEWDERSVQELAQAVGVSSKTITRLFQTELGTSPVNWRIRRRLDEACRLLRETELRVLDVAYESGFGSLSRFMEAFRLHFGVSPSEYRKRSQARQ